jgi:hypothetical protein
VQVIEEAFSSQKRPSNTSKHELLQFFSTFVGHFCPPGSGSGSTDPIESGSATLIVTVDTIPMLMTFYCNLNRVLFYGKSVTATSNNSE